MERIACLRMINRAFSASPAQRKPSIKFVGKRSLLKTISYESIKPVTEQKILPVAKALIPSAGSGPKTIGNGVDFRTLKGGAWFGRPSLSAAEINAIESGGATLTY